jgi:hypothetical protein
MVAPRCEFLALVCGSSSDDGVSSFDGNIIVYVSKLRTAEEAERAAHAGLKRLRKNAAQP